MRTPASTFPGGTGQAVIADMVHDDGVTRAGVPSHCRRRLAVEYETLDLEPVFGYEYEVYVTHAAGSASAGQPLGRTINGYSLSRISEAQPMFDAFLDRMDSIGIPVEMFHSEIGPGFFEFALAPAVALTSADRRPAAASASARRAPSSGCRPRSWPSATARSRAREAMCTRA